MVRVASKKTESGATPVVREGTRETVGAARAEEAERSSRRQEADNREKKEKGVRFS